VFTDGARMPVMGLRDILTVTAILNSTKHLLNYYYRRSRVVTISVTSVCMFVCLSVGLYVCLSYGNFRKPSRRKFIFPACRYIFGDTGPVFVYEDQRVKVKVSG